MPGWLIVTLIAVLPGSAQEAKANEFIDVPARECAAGGDKDKRYFLIGPRVGADVPADGCSVLLVLPGGDGGEAFHTFVKRVFKHSVPEGYVVAQLVAHKWNADQKIVWPSKKDRVAGARFSTEEFIEAVVADVSRQMRVNKQRVFQLAWSSGGPAAYAASLQPDRVVSASYIAMSVFLPRLLPPLTGARGHAYYIEHSREDRVCVFDFAERAEKYLSAQGAIVKLTTYEGGHGWHGAVYERIRAGIEWMEQNAGKTPTSGPATLGVLDDTVTSTGAPDVSSPKREERERESPALGDTPTNKNRPLGDVNLLLNGGFENGTAGWMILNNSGRATIEADRKEKKEGTRSMRIMKKGGIPIDVLRQNITELPKSKKLTISASIKSQGVKNAFLKFFIYDAQDNPLQDDVDVERVTGTADWRRVERTYEVPENAASAAVMVVMVLEGTMWVDEVEVRPAE